MINLGVLSGLKRPLANVMLCGVVMVSLQGCVEMVLGGAVLGTFAAADRRTLGAQTEDKAIGLKASARMSDVAGENGHVNVNSFNRKVLLTGEVNNEQIKAAVEREVRTIEGVESVANELAIGDPSNFTARSNDVYVTGKIKASFIDDKRLFANSIKVVTERGNVYLMGRVTQREGGLAGEVASGVNGVQRVIKVFEYITEEELGQISTTK
jgi:osmotically-inducible protein OsmY